MTKQPNQNPRPIKRRIRIPRQPIWSRQDQMKYLLFIIRFAIDQPQCFLSFYHWKPIKYFVKMSEFIGRKSDKQCKSFDQRKKRQYLTTYSHLTMLQWVVISLRRDFIQFQTVQHHLLELRNALHSSQNNSLSDETRRSYERMEQLRQQLMGNNNEGIFMN